MNTYNQETINKKTIMNIGGGTAIKHFQDVKYALWLLSYKRLHTSRSSYAYWVQLSFARFSFFNKRNLGHL